MIDLVAKLYIYNQPFDTMGTGSDIVIVRLKSGFTLRPGKFSAIWTNIKKLAKKYGGEVAKHAGDTFIVDDKDNLLSKTDGTIVLPNQSHYSCTLDTEGNLLLEGIHKYQRSFEAKMSIRFFDDTKMMKFIKVIRRKYWIYILNSDGLLQ